jgi:hypothetical protein
MSDKGNDIVYAAFFLGMGILSFFKGFKRLNEKRLIENTPTSTVRGLAMGLVELAGKARKTRVIKTPLSGIECVFYRYTVERYQRSGKSGKWVVIASGDSCYCPFLLDDGTGTIVVSPQHAELIMPVDYRFETGPCRSLPDNLIDFMVNNGLEYRGFLGNYSLRFKEWFIEPDDDVYVLGTAQKRAEVNTDKDGIISQEECAPTAQGDTADVVIGKGDVKQAFIISDESQTQITQGLSWQVFFGVFGGATLSLAMLAYLLFRLRIGVRF